MGTRGFGDSGILGNRLPDSLAAHNRRLSEAITYAFARSYSFDSVNCRHLKPGRTFPRRALQRAGRK
jgi:hypothetical protein